LVFDRTGSYRVPLAAFGGAAIIAAMLVTRLGPYRFEAPFDAARRPARRRAERPSEGCE